MWGAGHMEAETGERGNWRKVVKRYKLPVIREIGTREVMYNLMTTAKTAVMIHKEVVRRVNPKSSQHKENCFFLSYLLFVSI